jgi:hypothetical protein
MGFIILFSYMHMMTFDHTHHHLQNLVAVLLSIVFQALGELQCLLP